MQFKEHFLKKKKLYNCLIMMEAAISMFIMLEYFFSNEISKKY